MSLLLRILLLITVWLAGWHYGNILGFRAGMIASKQFSRDVCLAYVEVGYTARENGMSMSQTMNAVMTIMDDESYKTEEKNNKNSIK